MKKKETRSKLPWIISGVVILIVAAVYIGMAVHYQGCFLPNTRVNGADASGRTWSEVEKELVSVMDTYVLNITGRNDLKDRITSQDIDMSMDFGSSVKDAQDAQNEWAWPVALFKKDDITLESVLSYDEKKLESRIKAMNCMDKKQALAPKDAYISDYDEKNGFSIIPEKENNRLDKKIFTGMVEDALNEMQAEINLDMLEKAEAYKKPAVYKDDKTLNSVMKQMNKLTKATITYRFGNDTEKVTGEMIAGWLTVNKDNKVKVDSEKVREYINSLARKYDTYNGGGTREFKTSYGNTISITGGDYGWWMNRVTTTEELAAAVKKGKDVELKPVYYQTAANYGDKDYGDTYVEINLTAQRLFLYKNGKRILETDFVSGKPSIKNTPSGVYGITYKERAHTMVGDASDYYRVETSFWMPYAGNVGMHDATWRSRFGGSLYQTEGSHGCVNLPYYAARTIYETVDKGTPVISYRMDGTQRSATTAHSDRERAEIGIDAIKRIGTVSSQNYGVRKKIEWARQVYTDLSAAQRSYVTNYQTLVNAEKALRSISE
ncbi:MAG: L,D-transpeptidase family protein [Lachnospiraceae bacterium]|nr:L,D-transpeptidase family protein [Lachnospiraceae bacterium]